MMDSQLVFRAREGYDTISKPIAAGLDVHQLQVLFREEIGAFRRFQEWSDRSSADQDAEQPNVDEEGNNANDEAGEKLNSEPAPPPGGHLAERLENFDSRTSPMAHDWYVRFAEHYRQGSFLKKVGNNKGLKKRGNLVSGTWAGLTQAQVKFLHWVGFDPASELKPPNADTTDALGFLCYDFMGRVVERAIQVRWQRKQYAKLPSAEGTLKCELPNEDQLEMEDIEEAARQLEPVCLFSSDSNGKKKSKSTSVSVLSTHLYFGPGFEDRLELEMDELLAHQKKRADPSDLEFRKKEDEMFEALLKRPMELETEQRKVSMNRSAIEKLGLQKGITTSAKKRGRPRKHPKPDPNTPKRKRGRPRKYPSLPGDKSQVVQETEPAEESSVVAEADNVTEI